MRSLGVGIIVGALVFVAPGLLALSFGLRNIYRGVASKGWPTAAGVVIESSSSTSTSIDKDTRRTSTSYNPKTVFQYRVGDTDFTTTKRRFGQIEGSGDATEAAMELLRFPLGKKVQVSYNASNPSIATIRTGFGASALFLPFVGIGLMAIAALIIAIGRESGLSGGAGSTGTILRIFGAVFCSIGCALLVPAAFNLINGYRSTSWQTTKARVVYGTRAADSSSTLIDLDFDDSTRAVEAAAGDSTADAEILQESAQPNRLIYRYDVKGVRYFGNVRKFGQLAGSSDADWANSIAAMYPLGREVTVLYSPDDPNLSVLEPGIARETLYLPVAGLAFALFGLAVFVWAVPALAR